MKKPNSHSIAIGLTGQEARDRTRKLLEDILPASTIEQIKQEEDVIEAIRNCSYDMEKLGIFTYSLL